jgi:hypothetical protein
VGLLNVDGYYNLLLAFIDKAVDDGFIKPSQRHILVSAPDARDLVQKLEVIILSLPHPTPHDLSARVAGGCCSVSLSLSLSCPLVKVTLACTASVWCSSLFPVSDGI